MSKLQKIKVEKGVPLFKERSFRLAQDWPLLEMKEDDSFIVPEGRVMELRLAIWRLHQLKEGRWTVRKQPNGGFRCWRLH